MKVVEIPINEIKIPKSYTRLAKDGAVDKLSQEELMESIKLNGLLQPICVSNSGNEYNLVYGKNRLEAYKKLKHKTIPSLVKPNLDEIDSVIFQLSENLLRNKPTLLDFGRFFIMLENDYGLDRIAVCKRTGRSFGFIVACINVYNAFHKKDHKKVKSAPASVLKKLATGIKNSYIKPAQAKEIAETVKTGLVKAKDVNNVINEFRKENNLEAAVKKNLDILHIAVTIPINKKDFEKKFGGNALKMATFVKELFYSESGVEDPNYKS